MATKSTTRKSIGIDIREANGKGAGKGRYCEEITRALIANSKDTEFFLFTKALNTNFPTSDRVKQIVIPGRSLLWHLNLRRYLKKLKVDFFLAPTSYIYPALAPKSQKLAIVVHDLIAFLYHENHHWFPTLVEKLCLGRAIKRSEFLITVSENTWQDLTRIKPEAKKKPHILSTPAVSPDFKQTSEKTLDLPSRYLLALGTLQPRKNFQAVFAAFSFVAQRQSDLHLCVVGGKGWKSSRISKSIPANLKDRIHFLSYVDHADLPEIYSRAQMLVFPSLYEGFGIPPLEAMACGCPVISSNTSSLPEVVGDAAIQLDPENITALTEAITVLLGPQMREIYRKRGLKQVQKFSWDESARKILKQIYARA